FHPRRVEPAPQQGPYRHDHSKRPAVGWAAVAISIARRKKVRSSAVIMTMSPHQATAAMAARRPADGGFPARSRMRRDLLLILPGATRALISSRMEFVMVARAGAARTELPDGLVPAGRTRCD